MIDSTSGRLSEALESPDDDEVAGRTAYLVIVWLSAVLGLGAHAFEAGGTTRVVIAVVALGGLAVWLHIIHRVQSWVIDDTPTERLLIMLAGVYLVLIALLATDSAHLVFLFGVYTLTFGFATSLRIAGVTSFIVTVIWIGGWLYHDLPSGALATPVLVWGTLMVITGVLDRITSQSNERRELLAEIHETRAQLAEAQRQRGVLAERQRMAAEIHDTLAQGFTSIVLVSQATGAQTQTISPEVLERNLSLIEETARDNLMSARRLVEDLRPAELDDADLVETLRRVGHKHTARTSVPVAVSISGAPRPIGGTAEVTILRIVQEALNNSGKHAEASQVAVEVTYADDTIIASVTDDGVGFVTDQDPAEVAGVVGGHGLTLMNDRVDAADGRLDITTGPGDGTRVTVVLPTRKKDAT